MQRFTWNTDTMALKLDDEGPWLLWSDHVKDSARYIVALSLALQLLLDMDAEHGTYSGRELHEIQELLGDDFNAGLVREATRLVNESLLSTRLQGASGDGSCLER